MLSRFRLLSRISFRLLAFNVLLVFLPVAGILFLDTYERRLLEAQERTMGQEGRLLAAALEVAGDATSDHARRILIQLGQRHQTRLRVVDRSGHVLADSAVLGPRRDPEQPPAEIDLDRSPRDRLLYRIGSLPFRLLQRRERASEETAEPTDGLEGTLQGPEVQAALAGRYGAATRVLDNPERTVLLHIAIPIRIEGTVAGAVVVSQSTSRILSALYAVRLDVFGVFLASLAAAVVLTLLVATTIARPLARLRRRAGELVDRRGRLRGGFETSHRADEIGELERALAELTRRLEEHLQFADAFASDLSHEFRNPLASIRSAADMATEVTEPTEHTRFLSMIQRDVSRMERLLSGARELSLVDARLDQEEIQAVGLGPLLSTLVESFRLRGGERGPLFALELGDGELQVAGSADRLIQVFENLIANAVSFSPPGGTVTVTALAAGARARVVVGDQGPGIPEEHRERVFSRFFSYRPGERGGDHTGLGLALVKAIVEGYGGSAWVEARSSPGAELVVELPLVQH